MSLLEFRQVSKSYGPEPVLQNVSFRLDRRETLGIIGPNGAGQTTLLRMALGLVAGSGIVTLDGCPVAEGLRRIRVGYFAGERTVPPGVRAYRWRSLFHDVDRPGDRRRMRMLSPGARQLLGLRTLFTVGALDLIVLDEPWNGLDPDAARWLSCAIRARRDGGAAVLVSSHRLYDLAGVCTRYLFLEHGTGTALEARDLSGDGTATAGALLATFERLRGSRLFRILH